jgi:hypothetical protein
MLSLPKTAPDIESHRWRSDECRDDLDEMNEMNLEVRHAQQFNAFALGSFPDGARLALP